METESIETREDLKPERRRFKLFQLRWKEPLGSKDCPYAYRYVLNLGLFAIRVHHWLRSDDKRHFHNHPYWFLTCVVKGSYTDVSELSLSEKASITLHDLLSFGSIRFRKASHTHYVDVPKGGAWSILLTGKPYQPWGFFVNGKLKKPLKYFHKFGHPPCDEQ